MRAEPRPGVPAAVAVGLVALVIAGIDIIETSFLLVVVGRSDARGR